jgi:hypothetical protein
MRTSHAMRASYGILALASALTIGCQPANNSSTTGGTGSGNNNGTGGGSSNGSSAGAGGKASTSSSGGATSSASGGSGGSSTGTTVGAGGGGGKSTSTTSGAGGSAGTSSGASGGASGSGGSTTVALSCVAGIPATTQIPRMKNAAYDAVVQDLLGLTTLAGNNNQPPSSLLADDSDGAITDIMWNGYLNAAKMVASEVMAGSNKSKFMSCDPTKDTSCLQNTVKTFGRKAFRRPLTDTEVKSFMRLDSLTPKGQPNEVAQAILNAFLASPSFIMLPELAQTKDSNGNLTLNSYEVATRLSFLLWGTVPDDTLNTAADGGQLTSKDQIATQAQRMLKSSKAQAVVTNFVHYYAAIQNGSHWVNNNTHDASKYPTWTDAAYAPALAEIDAFFQDIVLNGGKFKDLFLGSNGFVTKDTAPLYGLGASSYGTTPTKVALDSTKRPGFLTRVGFLSTFSKFDVTSPILRGAFISGRVLGVDPGTPDPNFTRIPIPPGTYTTQRQAIEALTANEPCHSCHGVNINPSGYVLEHYNSIGTWQDKDPLGGDIDGTADVRFSATDTKTITNPLDMMTEIANLPEARHHYAQQWVAFASNRIPNSNDECTVNTITTNMASDSYPLLNVISDYTQADSFRLRTVGN